MYPFMTLDDGTEIVHSEKLDNGTVKVYVEKPDEQDGFHFASCYLPKYEWNDVFGFTENDIQKYQSAIQNNARLIFEHTHNTEQT